MTRDFAIDLEAVRGFLHILSVTVWLGGQIVVAGLVPLLRKIDRHRPVGEGEMTVTQQVARRFNRVAWPFFALAIITGLWHTSELDWSASTGLWKTLFFVKLLLVVVSGVAAWLHTRAQRAPERALFASLASVSALVALLLAAGFNTTVG